MRSLEFVAASDELRPGLGIPDPDRPAEEGAPATDHAASVRGEFRRRDVDGVTAVGADHLAIGQLSDLDRVVVHDEGAPIFELLGFGNDPRKLYEVEPYYQLGEPRVYGISLAGAF